MQYNLNFIENTVIVVVDEECWVGVVSVHFCFLFMWHACRVDLCMLAARLDSACQMQRSVINGYCTLPRRPAAARRPASSSQQWLSLTTRGSFSVKRFIGLTWKLIKLLLYNQHLTYCLSMFLLHVWSFHRDEVFRHAVETSINSMFNFGCIRVILLEVALLKILKSH